MTRTYLVPGISCGHCKTAIEAEVTKLDGVADVEVSVDNKTVIVAGDVAETAVRAAIDEAGYEVVGVV